MSKDKTGWDKYRRGPVRRTSNEITLRIDSLGNNGDGVGRHEGQVVFVPATLPGDRVRIQPTVRKKNLIRGKVMELLSASAHRQEPACPWFGQCGGCDWQHVPYPMQLEAKVAHLRDTLQRIGHLHNPVIETMVPSPNAFHYRNRIRGVIDEGRFHYHARGSNALVAIDQCAIAEPAINAQLLLDLSQGEQGRVEIAVTHGGVSTQPLDDTQATDTGFTQVNTALSEQLTDALLALADQYPCTHYLDLYCGHGHWSRDLASRFPERSVTGVDASQENIRLARQHAQEAALTNIQFHHARVELKLASLPLAGCLCIVDPPRAGLADALCRALCKHPPDIIAYISCHPASLARDLAKLADTHFQIVSITPFDMFPQTAHLESLTVLKARDKAHEN